MAFARTVVESPIAVRVIDAEIKKIPRLYDIYEGIKWRLARGPEEGCRVPKTNPATHVMHSYHWGVASVVIAYVYDEDQVDILDVRVELHH